jgi:hypothetical protein
MKMIDKFSAVSAGMATSRRSIRPKSPKARLRSAKIVKFMNGPGDISWLPKYLENTLPTFAAAKRSRS